ncbi:MAG: hypothetical protein A4E62_02096 [Syntrophorhabdus sp. PtaU1.Bin002]|nr:MAG: hypothetical protein A4E62_02096 [Syntrophorhabdus sp. PtaU1.Bin002]
MNQVGINSFVDPEVPSEGAYYADTHRTRKTIRIADHNNPLTNSYRFWLGDFQVGEINLVRYLEQRDIELRVTSQNICLVVLSVHELNPYVDRLCNQMFVRHDNTLRVQNNTRSYIFDNFTFIAFINRKPLK